MDVIREQARLTLLLGVRSPAVAIAFREAPPAGVPRVAAMAPAGCAYWRLAAEGRTFYTEAADHLGCPVGAHTHGIDLPPDASAGLQSLLTMMIDLQYLKQEEIPSIPRRPGRFGVAVYAPLDRMPCEPDVVLVYGHARQMMLLVEAAASAGVAGEGPAMGRPTCAVLPAAIASGRTAASFGCVGNRVYTGAADDEATFALPGSRLGLILDRLEVIVSANRSLEQFHRERLQPPR
jgi:uncharacterized protein (DUF169 family)